MYCLCCQVIRGIKITFSRQHYSLLPRINTNHRLKICCWQKNVHLLMCMWCTFVTAWFFHGCIEAYDYILLKPCIWNISTNLPIVFVLQVVAIRDIIPPPQREAFNDVYIAYELMDTDLHQIIRSNQVLSEEHCQVDIWTCCLKLCPGAHVSIIVSLHSHIIIYSIRV